MNLQKYRVQISIGITAILLVTGLAIIFWARGFKPDFRTGKIERTGLIVATSVPTGAQVFLNDRLTSATDTNIAYLDPGIYKVRIQKDGYSIWEKDVEVRADLATEIKAALFPTAPQISPLTITGAANPVLSPDSSKIVYGVSGVRGGLYILPMSEGIFPFRQDARLLVKNQDTFDFSKATFIFSPDSKEVVAVFMNDQGVPTANILAETDKSQQEIRDITGSLNATLNTWQEELINIAQIKAQIVPGEIKEATAEAQPTINDERLTINDLNYFPTGLMFSPDEEKVLYKDKSGRYKVYDFKKKGQSTLPEFSELISLSWYPDSNHLIVAQKGSISAVEADGANKMVIYSGKFENGFVFAHPSGQRLIILTALTQADGTPPNLYSINLK